MVILLGLELRLRKFLPLETRIFLSYKLINDGLRSHSRLEGSKIVLLIVEVEQQRFVKVDFCS